MSSLFVRTHFNCPRSSFRTRNVPYVSVSGTDEKGYLGVDSSTNFVHAGIIRENISGNISVTTTDISGFTLLISDGKKHMRKFKVYNDKSKSPDVHELYFESSTVRERTLYWTLIPLSPHGWTKTLKKKLSRHPWTISFWNVDCCLLEADSLIPDLTKTRSLPGCTWYSNEVPLSWMTSSKFDNVTSRTKVLVLRTEEIPTPDKEVITRSLTVSSGLMIVATNAWNTWTNKAKNKTCDIIIPKGKKTSGPLTISVRNGASSSLLGTGLFWTDMPL